MRKRFVESSENDIILSSIYDLTHMYDDEGNEIPAYFNAQEISDNYGLSIEEVIDIAEKNGYNVHRIPKGDNLVNAVVIADNRLSYGDIIKDVESEVDINELGEETDGSFNMEEDYMDEVKPFNKKQIFDELKRETNNFTTEDVFRYYFFEEQQMAKSILEKHYNDVDWWSDDDRFAIDHTAYFVQFRDPKKGKKKVSEKLVGWSTEDTNEEVVEEGDEYKITKCDVITHYHLDRGRKPDKTEKGKYKVYFRRYNYASNGALYLDTTKWHEYGDGGYYFDSLEKARKVVVDWGKELVKSDDLTLGDVKVGQTFKVLSDVFYCDINEEGMFEDDEELVNEFVENGFKLDGVSLIIPSGTVLKFVVSQSIDSYEIVSTGYSFDVGEWSEDALNTPIELVSNESLKEDADDSLIGKKVVYLGDEHTIKEVDEDEEDVFLTLDNDKTISVKSCVEKDNISSDNEKVNNLFNKFKVEEPEEIEKPEEEPEKLSETEQAIADAHADFFANNSVYFKKLEKENPVTEYENAYYSEFKKLKNSKLNQKLRRAKGETVGSTYQGDVDELIDWLKDAVTSVEVVYGANGESSAKEIVAELNDMYGTDYEPKTSEKEGFVINVRLTSDEDILSRMPEEVKTWKARKNVGKLGHYEDAPVYLADSNMLTSNNLMLDLCKNYGFKLGKYNKKNESLEEDIEKHDELNPKLFDGEELKPEIKDKIEQIAYQFIRELNESDIKFVLKDIVLLGSNVSYNYTKDSDLDIHLIADSSGLNCPEDLYPLLYSAYRSMFNKNYDIRIKGIPAEIYVEMDEPQAKSNGIYSLNNGWIKKPEQRDIPDLDRDAFESLFNEWEEKYFDLIERENTAEEIEDFIEDIYDLRKESIANEGEYGLGNLVFKEFRNIGYLDNLKEIRRQDISNELSLEHLDEELDVSKYDTKSELKNLASGVTEEGTYSEHDGQLRRETLTSGYMASFFRPEITDDDIKLCLTNIGKKLGQPYFGIWKDGVEISYLFNSRANAERFAEIFNQKAIFDLANKEDIPNNKFENKKLDYKDAVAKFNSLY